MLDVAQHLQTEIARPDPWGLESNLFEHQRYATMLNMIRSRGPFARALEIGCAGGFFTQFLVRHSRSLHIVDVLPECVERARRRLNGSEKITSEVASVTEGFAVGQQFDLVVIAEVLCYLPTTELLRRAVDNIAAKVAPGGLLIFGSAVDATCARWGLRAGAETAMLEWERSMVELDRASCVGSYWGEDSRIVAYTPKAQEAQSRPLSSSWKAIEDNFVPHKAMSHIPATSVLVLAPHPDDEVFGCGGAITRHVGQGVPVKVVIATDGAGDGAGADTAYVRQRFTESRQAAAQLGYGEPEFWEFPDRTLQYGEPLIQRIMSLLKGVDLVYAPSLMEVHPDHLALGLAAAEAVRRMARGVRLAFYEVGAPLQPNLLLDISNVAGQKQTAMACFTSQLRRQTYDQQITALNRYRTYTLPADVTAAEGFLIVSAEELARDPLKFHWSEEERRIAEAADRAIRRAVADMQNSISWRITAPLRAGEVLLRSFLANGPPVVTRPLRSVLRAGRALVRRVAGTR